MKISLIITTFNRPAALELVLFSVARQTMMPDDVIIADDGSTKETAEVIKKFTKLINVPIIHSWQENKGFRLSRSRNLAVTKSKNEYLVFIDGDMILHKDFVKDHVKFAKKGFFLQGSRSFITEDFTDKLILNKHLKLPSIFSKNLKNKMNFFRAPLLTRIVYLFKNRQQKKIRTCNFSLFKQDLINVNGFNEEFKKWGQEDSEFVERLYNSGIYRRNIKFSALQYHLYHQEGKANKENCLLLKNTIDRQLTWCENGIDKHLSGNV